MSRLVTTIKWREYPKEKPIEHGWVIVLPNGSPIPEEAWYEPLEEGGRTEGIAWTDANDCPVRVTHFALPEDIETAIDPEQPEGAEGET